MPKTDETTWTGSLNDAESKTLTVESAYATDVVLLVDDGTTDGTPASYDLTQRIRSDEFDRYQFYDELTNTTARSVVDTAAGQEWQVEITNVSGAPADYAVTLEARK